MTLAVAPAPRPPLPVGALVYLASYLIRVGLKAETTPPDTPDLYSADLEVQGDIGKMDTAPLRGPQGFPGRAEFQLRRQDRPIVNTPDELPEYLTDTLADIGKYWEIDTVVDGVIVNRDTYIWWGTAWRKMKMGTTGPPGAVPEIIPMTENLPPQEWPTYPDATSFTETDGPRYQPTWRFRLAVPRGIPGKTQYLSRMPDVDLGSNVTVNSLLACGGTSAKGHAIWRPMSVKKFATQYFSVPESAFTNYSGADQRHQIAKFKLPAQDFQYTPVVWGHLGSGGFSISSHPLQIGVEVWLGAPLTGELLARGLGNTIGEINITPHYSTNVNQSDNITPTNNRAIVPAGKPAILYVNLRNDGVLGFCSFDRRNAQLFVLVQPMHRGEVIEPWSAQ